MTCNHNHNRNLYSKSTVIMIIFNRNHDFFLLYITINNITLNVIFSNKNKIINY